MRQMNKVRRNRAIYELSKNARITTKALGKKMRISQQAVSYLLSTAIQKGFISGYKVVVDPSKIGLNNIIVFYDYEEFDRTITQQIKKDFAANPHVVSIEECAQGADLICEFSVPNLSLFNKQNKELLSRHPLRMTGIYPVMVRHLFSRDYLVRRPLTEHMVVSGDRDMVDLTPLQDQLIRLLKKNVRIPTTTLAVNLNKDAKTIIKVRKELERKQVIRKYDIVLNHKKLGMVSYHMLIDLDKSHINEADRLIDFCRMHKNAIQATRIIGDYELLITFESLSSDIGAIQDIRSNFKVNRYKLIESQQVVYDSVTPDDLLM